MTVETEIAALTGQLVTRMSLLDGCDHSEFYKVTLEDGTELTCKCDPHVAIEAEMLRKLGQFVLAPQPLHVSKTLLLRDYIIREAASPAHWRSFGQSLRKLHLQTGETYGWDTNYKIQSVEILNEPSADWPSFWGDKRLAPFVSSLPEELSSALQQVIDRLPDLLPKSVLPALLHGDLWQENILFNCGQGWMINPACYYGHTEVDLAMLNLFGQPSDTFWEGYGETEPGYHDRQPLYQLWPTLVHYRLFGDRYRNMTERLMATILA